MTQILARALVEVGHEVRVVGLYESGYPSPEYECDRGVRIWRRPRFGGRFGWVVGRYWLIRLITHWSRKDVVDLVEVPDWQGPAAAWPRLPVPVIARLHGSVSYFASEMNQPIRRETFWLERSSLKRADSWASVSRYTAGKTQKLFALNREPLAISYNPVELQAAPPLTDRSRNRVVFSGTLTPKKGIFPLIEAWPQVVTTCPAAELHFYGKDTHTKSGRSMQLLLLSRLGEVERQSVRFHGHVSRDRILQALQTARVAVFPSFAEAFAIAPLEAMACGCPTISSRRGSGPELINDCQHGLLVDPEQPETISNAIHRVLTNDRLAGALAQAGRDRVRREFSLNAILPRNEEVYRRCIARFREKSARG
jgi:glycosyltransferase involved in cell wall biosynthesis